MDTIADSVNPGLAILALGFPWLDREAIRKRGSPWSFWACTLLSLIVVYAIMFVDNRFGLWPSFGLDYSTHTAFAVAVITSLAVVNCRWLFFLVPVLIGYAALMMYLGYHSLMDILAAALVIAPITWSIHQIGTRSKSALTTTHQN